MASAASARTTCLLNASHASSRVTAQAAICARDLNPSFVSMCWT
jgi:hypothetical protein